MTLPTPEQVNELSRILLDHGKRYNKKWHTFDGMKQILDRNSGAVLSKTASTAAQKAVTSAGAAGGVATGSALVPLGAALAPWIGAATIALQSGTIFDLHDLRDHAAGRWGGDANMAYACVCGRCQKNIQYVLDKKERNVGRIAIGVATIGTSAIVTSTMSVAKSFMKNRPKERVSREIVESARGGCTVAIATIFLLSGSWSFMNRDKDGKMRTAVAIMSSVDGWEVLKAKW